MTLNPGDIGFVEYNADNPDSFGFVTLAPLSGGETLQFTDHGWLASGGFRDTEGVLTWTTPASGVGVGTVIDIENGVANLGSASGNLFFSTSGDQVIAFQGSVSSPSLIAGLNNNSSDWASDATSSNTSALPAGLVPGESAIAISEVDNAVYSGITSGEVTTLRQALYDPANWTGDNANRLNFTGSFDLGDGSGGDNGGDNGGGDPDPLTPIYDIQGFGETSPLVGATVTLEGIVTGDFQNGDADNGRNLNGFFVQDATGDGDSSTSDGIFVYDPSFLTDVQPGDQVRITGSVSEFFDATQVSASSIEIIGSGSVAPTNVELPTASVITNSDGELIGDLEQYEGMLVTFTDTLTVDEYFNYDRFGEIRLSEGGRPYQFTSTNAPSISGYQAHLEDLARRTITLDDGLTVQNPDTLPYPAPQFGNNNSFRGGDTVTNLTGNLGYSFGQYRLQPTEDPNFVSVNERPTTPEEVNGRLKVASFNVLNYFTTLDDGNTQTAIGQSPRGADDLTRFGVTPATAEFDRQTEKLVTTILDIDADVLGLVELENDFLPGSSGNAIERLVMELNDVAGAGTYDWVYPGRQFVDVSDAISVGVIYKPDAVEVAPGTSPAILDDSSLPPEFSGETLFDGRSTNRASLAVTFEENSSGESFTIAVNHFKSKGSIFNEENAAIGDGQGNNNPLRVRAAQALEAWLDSDPTGSNDEDLLILGDLNAYANEDPITTLEGLGYTDLAEQFTNGIPYSYLFDGQLGTLDYALANSALLGQVTGATEWHVNADEPDALDYNLNFGRNPNWFDGSTPFRNSDHDPLIVGLDLGSSGGEANVIDGTAGRDVLTGTSEADILTGFENRDTLTGGGGSDDFVYTSLLDGGDILTDFEVGSDRIVLTQLLDSVGYAGSDPIADGYVDVIERRGMAVVTFDADGAAGPGRDRSFILVRGVSATDLNDPGNFAF